MLAAARAAAVMMLTAGAVLAPTVQSHPDLLAQVDLLSDRIRAEPDDADLYIRRGDLHRRHEDHAAAALDFEAARALAPDHPEIDFYQGRLALESGDSDAAEGYLDRYLNAHPRHPGAWRLRAETALRQGDRGTAADAFGRAVGFSGAPSPALFRQWVLALLARGDRPGALTAVDAGLERVGTEVTLLGLGADTALAAHDSAAAQSYLERLPAGLKSRAPWSDRIGAADCLAAHGGNAEDDQAGCAAGAVARLDALLQVFLAVY